MAHLLRSNGTSLFDVSASPSIAPSPLMDLDSHSSTCPLRYHLDDIDNSLFCQCFAWLGDNVVPQEPLADDTICPVDPFHLSIH